MAKLSLSRLDEILVSKRGTVFHIGIDVHKKSYHVGLLGEDGIVYTLVVPANPDFLVKKLKKTGIIVARVIYESGPTGFVLARTLQEAGYDVLVVAPSRVPRPVTAGAKTDRLDCIQLAEYSAKDMVRGIAIPTETEEAERSVVRRRHDIIESIRRVKQRIRSLLLFLGRKEPAELEHWCKDTPAALLKIKLPHPAKQTMRSLVRELKFIEAEKKRVEKQLEIIRNKPHHQKRSKCLQSVQGVGPITSITFLLELFSPERFRNGEEVASILGLAPIVRQSGESKGRGKLRPVGQKRLRSLLIEAAWGWKARDPWASQRYGKILRRCGMPQKAIVALARHLAVILWRLAVEMRPYRHLEG